MSACQGCSESRQSAKRKNDSSDSGEELQSVFFPYCPKCKCVTVATADNSVQHIPYTYIFQFLNVSSSQETFGIHISNHSFPHRTHRKYTQSNIFIVLLRPLTCMLVCVQVCSDLFVIPPRHPHRFRNRPTTTEMKRACLVCLQ